MISMDALENGYDVQTDWLNMLETISISASAAAIFSADEGCGRWLPKRKDIVGGDWICCVVMVDCSRS